MHINTFRQYINDSTLGRAVNHTSLGILVEGISRLIADITEDAPKLLPYVLSNDELGLEKAIEQRTFEKIRYEQNVQNHYSLTSPLWKAYALKEKTRRLRVPLDEALQRRRWI